MMKCSNKLELANTAQAHSMYVQFHIKLVAQLDGLSIGILIYVLIVKNPIQITEKYSAMQCIVCICPPSTNIQQIFSISIRLEDKIRRLSFLGSHIS